MADEHVAKIGKGRIVFRKTLLNTIRYTVLADKYAAGESDEATRSDFAYIVGHIDKVTGLSWKPIDQRATRQEFDESYWSFLELFDDMEDFHKVVHAVNDMYAPLANDVEKPDAALTDEEQADPNS